MVAPLTGISGSKFLVVSLIDSIIPELSRAVGTAKPGGSKLSIAIGLDGQFVNSGGVVSKTQMK